MQKIFSTLFIFLAIGLFVDVNARVDINSIEKAIIADSTMSNAFTELEKENIYITYSPDRKMRLFSWKDKNMSLDHFNYYIIQYQVAPNKTKYITPKNFQLDYDLNYEDFQVSGNTVYLNQIHQLKNGLYLISGKMSISANEEHLVEKNITKHIIFAFDIGKGKLKYGYLFMDEEENVSYSLSYNIADDENHTGKHFEIDENRLIIPETNNKGILSGNTIEYFFCGSFFEKSEQYSRRIEKYGTGKPIISKIVFKDEENSKVIDNIYPGVNFSIVVYVSEYSPTTTNLQIKDDEISILDYPYLTMKNEESYCFIENFSRETLHSIKERHSSWYRKKVDLNVAYTAGRDWAEPFEILRYTAIKFTRKTTEEEQKSVRWAIEIDGKLEYLDPDLYSGNQIDLRMKEEWLEKTVKVFAYIGEVDKKVFQETKVIYDKGYTH